MLKKIILLICFLFASVSFLFALDEGSFILYPEVGLGVSGGFATVWNPEGASRFLGSNTTLFKKPQMEPGLSWSIGCGADYAFTDWLGITSGLFIDKTAYRALYKKTGTGKNDLEIDIDFIYLTIPVGLHFYRDIFMIGGGFYFGAPLFCSSSVKFDATKETNLNSRATIGLFIDAGLNFYRTDANNLMVFLRFKNDLTYAYKEDDIVTNIKTFSLNLTAAYGFKIN